jgi:hypothetical protein
MASRHLAVAGPSGEMSTGLAHRHGASVANAPPRDAAPVVAPTGFRATVVYWRSGTSDGRNAGGRRRALTTWV